MPVVAEHPRVHLAGVAVVVDGQDAQVALLFAHLNAQAVVQL